MDFKSLEELYQKDEKKVTDGVTLAIGINEKGDDITVTVAEAGTAEHDEAHRKYERAFERSRNNEKKRRLVMAKIVAEGVLKNWSGVLDSEGNEIEYTVEKGIEALVKYDQLMIEVMNIANTPENFRLDASEETEKNLKTSSDGRSDTEST